MPRAGSFCIVLLFALLPVLSGGQEASSSQPQQQLEQQRLEEDARRQAAIAEFTQKMKDANYPALFDQAANEFSVPPDVLKAVAFAETRWDHLTWPAGETVSPETGKPRPFGIMSLWDNKYFGHSLIEAANLIGRGPEELKQNPLQNMRGAAALLRKIYNETPRLDGSSESEIESWRYAIRVYCGIPEPDLNARHALDVYTFMNQGYHQYGVEWNAHPVNLEKIRQETRQIVAEEAANKGARLPTESNTLARTPDAATRATPRSAPVLEKAVAPPPVVATTGPEPRRGVRLWWFILVAFAASGILLGFFLKRSHRSSDTSNRVSGPKD